MGARPSTAPLGASIATTLTLILCSGLGVAMLALRIYVSREATYIFLVWNLMLAWMPYLLSLAASAFDRHTRRARWLGLVPLGAAWLAFFPNAPYLVTDFIHLRERPQLPIWYDALLLMSFAWSGCLLAIASLRLMQQIVARHAGAIAGWLFVAGTTLLGGLGVYLGRVLRWNSWDLLLTPGAIVADIVERLADPLSHPNFMPLTLLVGCFLLICYGTVLSLASIGALSAQE
jgi:uncharacterized membrane protein